MVFAYCLPPVAPVGLPLTGVHLQLLPLVLHRPGPPEGRVCGGELHRVLLVAGRGAGADTQAPGVAGGGVEGGGGGTGGVEGG